MTSSSFDFAVVRYTTIGSLDPTFDVDGKVTTDFAGGSHDVGEALVIQTDGKIVVVGDTGNPPVFGIARFNTNGGLDGTFGAVGKVMTDFGAGYGYPKQ